MDIKNEKVDVVELRQFLASMRTYTQAIKGFAEYNVEEVDIEKLKENNNNILIAANNLLEELNNLTDQIDDEMSNTDDVDLERYRDIIAFFLETGEVSVSSLQRKFRIGYNRATYLIDLLEKEGIIEFHGDSKSRVIMARKAELKLKEIKELLDSKRSVPREKL